MKYRICTHVWNQYNMRQRLQAFALQHVLEKRFGIVAPIYDVREPGEIRDFSDFEDKYMKFVRCYDGVDVKADRPDVVIFGSDQIINFKYGSSRFLFDEIVSNVPACSRIFYAPDSGGNGGFGFEKDTHTWIRDFMESKSVSIRSLYTDDCKLLSSLGYRIPVEVVDPTLLLGADEWRSISSRPRCSESYGVGEFDFYCCVTSSDIRENYKIRRTGSEEWSPVWTTHGERTPESFVWLIDNSNTVYTDSYHGLLFSHIFGKSCEILTVDTGPTDPRILKFKSTADLDSEINKSIRFLRDHLVPCHTYAAYVSDQDTRNLCSSGGVVAAIADEIISGGGSVYGASYTNGFSKVEHIRVTDMDSYYRWVTGSKYTMSDTSCMMGSLEEDLLTGKNVLVIGTPCQISVVKKKFGDRRNLFTVDFRCYGCSRPEVLENYVKSLSANGKIKLMSMRPDHKHDIVVEYSDGSKTDPVDLGDAGFLSRDTLSEECLNCRSHCGGVSADITVGDFWEYTTDAFPADFSPEKGTNIVRTLTPKGAELFGSVKGKCNVIEL